MAVNWAEKIIKIFQKQNEKTKDNKYTYYRHSLYWLNFWHVLISKGTSCFASHTLLIKIQYCYQFINAIYEQSILRQVELGLDRFTLHLTITNPNLSVSLYVCQLHTMQQFACCYFILDTVQTSNFFSMCRVLNLVFTRHQYSSNKIYNAIDCSRDWI